MKRLTTWLAAAALGCAALGASAQTKPTQLKLGITTFLTGPASVFGVPAKAAAEIWIEEFNAAGGLGGVKLAPTFIDEGLGAENLLSEYRRIAQEPGEKVMLASISSGNCNAVAPVAEDLKVVNVLWDCSTEKVLEARRYKFVFRTSPHAGTEMVGALLHLLRVKPDFKTIAVINQDYAWGRDSWEIFRNAMLAMKPDVKIVAELFPKFGAPDYSTEITRLIALKPDVILSTAWGGDLDTLVRQSAQRGLMARSQFVLPLLESSLERLGKTTPDGVLVGMNGDAYFGDPETQNDPTVKRFYQKFAARTGTQPIYPVAHMAQALQAVTDAYAQAIKANKGGWPTAEQVADTLRTLEFKSLSRPIRMREDGQSLQGLLYGVTKTVPGLGFPLIDQLVFVPADLIIAPVGQQSPAFVRTLSPDLASSNRIKLIGTARPPAK